jgi:hypothetical protein
LPKLPIQPKQQLSKRALTILWLFACHFLPFGNFPLGQKRNGDAMTFKGNRTIKRRHFGKPAAADDNKNGRTLFLGGLINLFPHIAVVS